MNQSLLTGVTLIRNGNDLNYPWKACIKQLCTICDDVIVNYGESTDNTEEELIALQKELKFRIYKYKWDMSNTGDGRELAQQVNNILPHVYSKWVLYLQADEFVHENDKNSLRFLLETTPQQVDQVELYRTYFWGWDKRAPQYEIFLGRVFRRDTHEVGGDGMYIKRKDNHKGIIIRSGIPIYHYSRVGSEEEITKRVRNLDTLFHPRETVNSFPNFQFGFVADNDIVPFNGTHPKYIKEFISNAKTNNRINPS